MIKFPTVHIAESVINRILDVADSLPQGPQESAGGEPSIPPVGNTGLLGQALDEALVTPPPPLPGIEESGDPGELATGKPLLDTLLTPGS
jgi:hypothetical protein